MKKVTNKRAQSEVSMGTLLMIIIGVIGLVLVGMFVYNSWNKINTTVGTITPEDRTVYAQACDQALKLGADSYCKDFKEVKIGKEKQYFNCKTLNTDFALNLSDSAVTCGATVGTDYCTYLKTTEVVKAGVSKKVNNVLCTTSVLVEAQKRVDAATKNKEEAEAALAALPATATEAEKIAAQELVDAATNELTAAEEKLTAAEAK